MAGLHIQGENILRQQTEILFQNVYGRRLSPNTIEPNSKYLSWFAAHPSWQSSFYLHRFIWATPPSSVCLAFVCWQAGTQKVDFCFMHLHSVVPAVMCKSHHSWRTLSDTLHRMDYYEIQRERTRIQIWATFHSMYWFILNTSIYFPHDNME